jgi:hypothetical protein
MDPYLTEEWRRNSAPDGYTPKTGCQLHLDTVLQPYARNSKPKLCRNCSNTQSDCRHSDYPSKASLLAGRGTPKQALEEHAD